ncbi:MAG: hypothetical protein DBY39_01495 [Clostridiales bacterium]|nr:MAG: hypothetical protein DBY39_01495 [Clostridiales bacterium]
MSFLNDNFIADFFILAIEWIYQFLHEYSLTIIVVALFVRLVLLPIDMKQRINSKKMVSINPEIEGLKKRYGNNPEQLNLRINKLYKERGISPMAGCLPMLLQLVFLLAFYGALRSIAAKETMSLVLRAAENGASSIELTRWLWVNNLWQPDSGMAGILPSASEFLTFLQSNNNIITPQTMGILQSKGLILFNEGILSVNEAAYNALSSGIIAANGLMGLNNGWFILPLLSGGAMFLQQWISSKLNPNPAMEQQMGMMKYIYPILSFVICLSSNTMFAIYWMFTSIYSVAVDFFFNFYYKRKEEKGSRKKA